MRRMKKTLLLIDFISTYFELRWAKLVINFNTRVAYKYNNRKLVQLNDWELVHFHSNNYHQILSLLRNLPDLTHGGASADGVQGILKSIHLRDYPNLYDGTRHVNSILLSLIRFLGDSTGNYWGSLWNKADIIIVGLLTVLFIFETLF